MRCLTVVTLATLLFSGLHACMGADAVLPPKSASDRHMYVTHAHTQLTAWEIDLAKIEFKLPRACRDQSCTESARLAVAQEDLRLARSRLEELRVARPHAWEALRLCVEETLSDLAATVTALKDGGEPLDPRFGSARAVDPASCRPTRAFLDAKSA